MRIGPENLQEMQRYVIGATDNGPHDVKRLLDELRNRFAVDETNAQLAILLLLKNGQLELGPNGVAQPQTAVAIA